MSFQKQSKIETAHLEIVKQRLQPPARAFDATHSTYSDEKKTTLGQFLTPAPVAEFMASMVGLRRSNFRILDAGAGRGALSAALVRHLCRQPRVPSRISVTAYEVDSEMIGDLTQTLDRSREECGRAHVDFQSRIFQSDFIESTVPGLRDDFFSPCFDRFTTAILNPPYRKINSQSKHRRLLSSIGIETTNLYSAFLMLAGRLLGERGEMVAITPRSFCNGPYFKTFREEFLRTMCLLRLHVFESRSAAFRSDDVLQENVILHAVKSATKPRRVIISMSTGPKAAIAERELPFEKIVSRNDDHLFIHLPITQSDIATRLRLEKFSLSLPELGLAVSTGRVVEFRAKEFLLTAPHRGSVPLIYPRNFEAGFVRWPAVPGKKPSAIQRNQSTEDLLIPSETYVLVKRFTSKEERRRVVAAVYDEARIGVDKVGFENHLNYFHRHGQGLSKNMAAGLAAFLNSTDIDSYFRQFNGHTQVNATDLRSLRYPSENELEQLGERIGETFPEQQELDKLVAQELS
jgi:adenine-specific DNA-methyltransferase